MTIVFENGDVIVLDNNVNVAGEVGGPYSRNASELFFDGRDKFATSLPVSVARAIWPSDARLSDGRWRRGAG